MSNDITITFDDIIKEWCDTLGIPERKGFAYYYEEYIEQQDSIWDSLDDHDE